MKLVHVVPAITEEASGPSYSVTRLCESLIEDGQSVTLAALDWAHMPSRLPYVKTFPLGLGPRRLGRSPAMKRWLIESSARGDIDMLHTHSLWMMPNVYPGLAAMNSSVPHIVSPRGTLSKWALQSGSSIKRLFWRLVQEPAIRAATCFHATAESEYEDIRCMGFRQPIAVIPNGIDIPGMHPSRATKTRRTLLFLGRIHPVKGLDILLTAWSAVQHKFPEWNLRIVGPGNGGHLGMMRRLASDLALERVEFAGALRGNDKWAAYEDADVFVLPTHSENFGIAVAEALAAGRPAIVTKGAPWQRLITEGAGWWIDIGVEPLAGCLEKALAESPDVLTAMGARGRQWMASEYSWGNVSRQMQETYLWMLQRGPKPACVIEN